MDLPDNWKLFPPEHMPHRLLLLAKMIDRETTKSLWSRFDVSLAEWRVLAYLGMVGAASASQIASAGEIDKAEVSRAVKKLTEAGRVERQPDGEHGKRFILNVTDDGRKLYETIRAYRIQYFEDILAGIDQEGRDAFADTLEIIAKNVIEQRES